MKKMLFFVGMVLILGVLGLRINISNSIPLGFYWIVHKKPSKGDYVIFCPPKLKIFDEAKQRGYINGGFCAGGYGYLMKLVVGSSDDTFSENSFGVFVNGHLLPFSRPLLTDDQYLKLPVHFFKNHKLKSLELLLMTDRSIYSFDARYFGPLTLSHIHVIRPIFIW